MIGVTVRQNKQIDSPQTIEPQLSPHSIEVPRSSIYQNGSLASSQQYPIPLPDIQDSRLDLPRREPERPIDDYYTYRQHGYERTRDRRSPNPGGQESEPGARKPL